jgi:DNA-binding transcriptional ArsR family regulator
MQRNAEAAPTSFDFVRPGSVRRRVLEYIADKGGELRSDCGQGLRRQICDALGERATQVSQALLALEKAGLLEREMDLERHRCHAIRLVAHRPAPPSMTVRQRSELEAAQQELDEAIRRATEAAHRVEKLRWSLHRVHR